MRFAAQQKQITESKRSTAASETIKIAAKLVSHSPRSATREYLSKSAAAWTCAAHLSLFESEREQLRARCWSRDSKIVCLLAAANERVHFLSAGTASEMLIGGERAASCSPVYLCTMQVAAIISLSTRDRCNKANQTKRSSRRMFLAL
jgi:hypothetical protein